VAPLAAVGASQRGQVSYLPLVTSDDLFAYPESVVGAAVVAGLLLALAVAGAARDRWTGWIAGATAVVPTAALLAAGAVIHLFTTRYLVFTLGGWAVLVGVGLAGSTRQARWVTLVLIALLGLPAQQALRTPGGHFDYGPRTAAASIAVQWRPGDGIVYEDVSWLRVAMDYYLPTTARPRDVLLARSASQTGNFVAAECADPAACLAGVPRLWVVHAATDRPLRRMTPAKAAAIRDGFAPAGSTGYGRVTVTLYVRNS
jgi:mannosyltransferase